MKLFSPFICLLLCAGLPVMAHAEDATKGCADVSVDGYRAPDYECLSQQMGKDTTAAKAAQKGREGMNVPVEKRAPNQIGLSTPAATSVRMGNTFGTSATPQRP